MDSITNDNSILDKVMASSEEQNLARFSPVDIVAKLFESLSSREQDILRRRFGLHGKDQETLEGIGKSYNVTRERIRQIENSTIKNIKSRSDFNDFIKPVETVVLSSLEKHGGIMAEDHLLEYLLQVDKNDLMQSNHLLFLLEKLTSNRLIKAIEDDYLPVWKIDFVDWDKINKTVDEVKAILENSGQPMIEEELLAKFRETETYKTHKSHYNFSDESMEPIYAHLRASQKIRQNPFKEWGLAHWTTVTPKRMGDKIYLVMKRHGEPLHFREITEHINDSGFDSKKAYAPTIHNELILDKRYVLVGRGIYALKEWGYIPGVVSDVIEAILSKASESLTRDDIVEKVLEQRLVKKGTVYLALGNTAKFAKNSEGKFYLIETASQPE